MLTVRLYVNCLGPLAPPYASRELKVCMPQFLQNICNGHDIARDTYGMSSVMLQFNTLRPRQNGCRFADDIFIFIFLNENFGISNIISLKFVLKGPINNITAALVQRPGDKPLFEPSAPMS